MSTSETLEQTRLLVQAAAAVCEDKKGDDTRILELDPVDSGLADFFLITSATNDRQAMAIADEIELRLKREFGVYAHSVEGRRQGEWILLDYVDFVVHIFLAERRAFYDIERLRKSAKPFTPEEFEKELTKALKEKTVAARKKSEAKPAAKKAPAKKVAAKKHADQPAVAKTAAPKAAKAPAKKVAAKKHTDQPAVAKTAAPKAAKAPAKKVAAKKHTDQPATPKSNKSAKPAVKKAVAKKAAKPAAKKPVAKKAPVKKAAKKK